MCTYGARSPDGMKRLVGSLAAAIPTATACQIPGAGHAAPFDATTNFVRVIADTIASDEAEPDALAITSGGRVVTEYQLLRRGSK